MKEPKNGMKPEKKQKSFDDEIAAQREKLRILIEKKNEHDRKEKERNQKAVIALIQSERLDAVPMEQWQAQIESIKRLLLGEAKKESVAIAAEQPVVTKIVQDVKLPPKEALSTNP